LANEKDETFWVSFLTSCCSFSDELAKLCFKHHSTMMTKAIHEYNLKNGPSIKFFEMVSKFRKMSAENLKRLSMI
jgi:hypothetical protein